MKTPGKKTIKLPALPKLRVAKPAKTAPKAAGAGLVAGVALAAAAKKFGPQLLTRAAAAVERKKG